MAGLKNIKFPLDFYSWFLLFYIVFLCISLYFYVSQWNFILWFFIIQPTIWLIFYVSLSYRYNIFIRSSYILGIPSISLIFIFDLFLFQHNNPIYHFFVIPTTLVIIFLFFCFGFFGFGLGLFIGQLITTETKLEDTNIQNNSVNFFLEGDEERKKAIIYLFINMIQQHLNYSFFEEGDKNYKTYRKNIFSVKNILIAFDDNKISIFPFIKDGLFVEPNPKPNPLLTIIGEQVLHLNTTTETATLLIEKLKNYIQTNKVLRIIKNIPYRKAIIAVIILLSIIFIIAFITHPEYFPINKLDLLNGFILIIIGSFFTAIANWGWKKIKKP